MSCYWESILRNDIYIPISHWKSLSIGKAFSIVKSENAVGGTFAEINKKRATELLYSTRAKILFSGVHSRFSSTAFW